ncbi:aminotransferase class V-fold PLP-dependent enzyme [Pandoraea anhela]|uniref:Cysteine desulfurase n=1 Tax=Pandoraea anhela TaxID=2508295 RepID=A0A5E4WBI5_9BURK|nr:aminotransferase class V-fold PLP-dependent enzyme [Pandoraea anhela]VVE22367.1 cysteine desulfurase [Pandoraea anhela]
MRAPHDNEICAGSAKPFERRQTAPGSAAAIHLNHASASLADQSVFDAQRRYLDAEARYGPHRAVEQLSNELDELPAALGALLGAHPEQIALTESASRGWALALSALHPARRLQVFVGEHEWGGNLCSVLATPRASLTVLRRAPGETWRCVVREALDRRERDAVPVVSLPLIGCASGALNALSGVATAVRDAGGWLFVDASQAVGQVHVDANALGADVLVFPMRKWLRGPRGIAVLCLSMRALAQFETPALIDVFGSCAEPTAHRGLNDHGMALKLDAGARRFQLYEHNPGLRLGALAAVRVAQRTGIDTIHAHTCALSAKLHERLQRIAGVSWIDRPDTGLLGVVFDNRLCRDIAHRLWTQGINVASIGRRYSPLSPHGDRLGDVLRLSAHIVTEPREIDVAVDALERIVTSPLAAT